MLTTAIDAARKAGNSILELSTKEIKYSMKNKHDILAEADLESEKIIINTIKSKYPNHSFLSEETGEIDGKSDYLWAIDPIDGTINYSRGIEEYCISIALAKNGKLVLAVVYQPVTDKLYTAEKGKGAFLNGKKIGISKESFAINMLLATDNSSNITSRASNFEILSKICTKVRHSRIFGSGALHLARLAEGEIDCYFKKRFNYWDFAAGTLLVQEAGGIVTDFKNRPIVKNSPDIIASNGKIHDELVKMLNSA
ncbi:MAG: inositol monophosphatase [Candidatus Curtissbacteria bacterium]|nr:inositol monophosphatase [Candidatus Curtissbacteria bacterium]